MDTIAGGGGRYLAGGMEVQSRDYEGIRLIEGGSTMLVAWGVRVIANRCLGPWFRACLVVIF